MIDLTSPSIILAGLGGIIWAVRLEGRVNTQEKTSVVSSKQQDERHTDLKDRLSRIEDKLDELPNLLTNRS